MAEQAYSLYQQFGRSKSKTVWMTQQLQLDFYENPRKKDTGVDESVEEF
jgi:hypothetical protein